MVAEIRIMVPPKRGQGFGFGNTKRDVRSYWEGGNGPFLTLGCEIIEV